MHALSILLPVYNWPIGPFVADLHRQCAAEAGLRFEIRCYDDASPDEAIRAANRAALQALAGVVFEVLPTNIGRAAIRNRLAADARYPWLLFLDGDSGLPDPHFIRRYREATRAEPAVAAWVGGTQYAATPPADPTYHLRWAYGRAREQRPAALRRRAPYAAFTLNNLLIQADIYRRFGLDESLGRTYGHEDTALGGALAAHHVALDHLDNPVLHLGLDPAPAFLAKTREAVANLVKLAQAGVAGPAASPLWRLAQRLRATGLVAPARRLLTLLEPQLLRNLHSPAPTVRFFDWWRLLLVLRALR